MLVSKIWRCVAIMNLSISRFPTRVFLLLIVLLTMAACGHSDDGQPSMVALTESDSGRTVGLSQGQPLSVSLRENSSTGFTWEIVPGSELFLSQQGPSQYLPDSNIVGAGGVRTFTFKAVASGHTTLRLIYHQPWATNVDPLKTFEVAIIVGG